MIKDWRVFYLGVVVPASVVIPFIPAVTRYSVFPRELRILSWFLLVDFVANGINSLLAFNLINNMPVMHTYTFVEFAILAIFYRAVFADEKMSRVINWLIPAFFGICVLNVLFFQDIFTFCTYTKSIEALIMAIFAVVLFMRDLDSIGGDKNVNAVLAYANTGILIYFSGSFLWFAACNLVPGGSVLSFIMWILHATFLVVFYILTAITLWKYKK
ncbi:MAG: hypothetical protein IAE95_12210 [Chitinophagaceae bacterium]|nr:hypothetical protein [Chitinophagaceae bacterium]